MAQKPPTEATKNTLESKGFKKDKQNTNGFTDKAGRKAIGDGKYYRLPGTGLLKA